MSFTRVGDTFAYDPRTLFPLEHDPEADERTVDEVAGFSVRLAAESGGKEHDETDRRVTRSMVITMAGTRARADRLMGLLVAAGVWEPDGTGWRLRNDPNYIHLLTQDEIDRNRIRKRDAKNPRLTVMALLRDGDNCRSCGRTVNWSDRKSPAGGTWEHVDIGNQPTQQHEYVVYCFGCQNDPMSALMPAPASPVYGDRTKGHVKKLLGKWPSKVEIQGYLTGQRTLPGTATERQRPTEESAPAGLRTSTGAATERQRPDSENAASEPAQRPVRATGNASGPTPPDQAERPPEARSGADQMIRGIPDLAPPGRVGSGSASPGLLGEGRAEPPAARPRRSRRSKSKPATAPTSEV